MWRNWRFWVLVALWLGPPVVFIWLGFLWLGERRWGLYGALGWLGLGTVGSLLMVRWTRSKNPVLPPIDWNAPRTFTPRDVQAWDVVRREAEAADEGSMERLTNIDTYIDVGKRLSERIARHYHPQTSHPVDHVPVVDILTALELAAEDLGKLCREVPGGDMLTPAHGKKAVQAANYLSKANQIYTYLLPIFQPAVGLARLGASKLMTEPAWRNMQQNLLRWFYRAYVNRLGTHLIELYSGRLSIGADQYRRLTGRSPSRRLGEEESGPPRLVVAVAGARDSGKSALVAALEEARAGSLEAVRARLEQGGFDEQLAERLGAAEFVEVPGYTVHESGEVARDRYTRRDAVEAAAESDFLLLVVDGRRTELTFDVKFAEAWSAWYDEEAHRNLDRPPALAVVTGADRPELTGEPIGPPGGGGCVSLAPSARESALRARLDAIRRAMPPAILDVVAVGLGARPPQGVADRLLTEMAAMLPRAERTALIRHFHRHSARSKARRFLGQVGRQGRRLLGALRSRGGRREDAPH